MNNGTLLDLKKCTIRFGGLTAVNELDLQIGLRDLIGLIGPNGAGKTTSFNIITGAIGADQADEIAQADLQIQFVDGGKAAETNGAFFQIEQRSVVHPRVKMRP